MKSTEVRLVRIFLLVVLELILEKIYVTFSDNFLVFGPLAVVHIWILYSVCDFISFSLRIHSPNFWYKGKIIFSRVREVLISLISILLAVLVHYSLMILYIKLIV